MHVSEISLRGFGSRAKLVREPGGPTLHPPPSPLGTFHDGPKMSLRVSRTQSHLFP